MKKSKRLSALICTFFAVMLFLPGPVRNVWAQTEEKTTAEDTKAKFSEEKKEFQKKAKARLHDLDKKIKELQAKSKEEMKEDIQKLKEQRRALGKDLKRLQAKGKSEWEEAKQKAQTAMDDFEKEYNKLRDKLKRE